MKALQKSLNKELGAARHKTKLKLESSCEAMSTRELWDSVKAMINMAPTKRGINVLNEQEKAQELNDFFSRFQTRDFSLEQQEVQDCLRTLDCGRIITIDHMAVNKLFSCTCPRKGSGPDGISGRLLKECSSEMAEAWSPIF